MKNVVDRGRLTISLYLITTEGAKHISRDAAGPGNEIKKGGATKLFHWELSVDIYIYKHTTRV